MQHLLEFNERPDLTLEDREMVIEDLVWAGIPCPDASGIIWVRH